MRVNQQPIVLAPTTTNPSIQGDQAARRFGMFFLGALAVVTIGSAVGIGVGNLAHYRYFPPNNQTNISAEDVYNLTSPILNNQINTGSMLLMKRLKRQESLSSSRLWMSLESSRIESQPDGYS